MAAQEATTSSGKPSRSEPRTKRDCDGSSSASGGAPWESSATHPSGENSLSATLKIEPVEALKALGPKGSAHPSESAR